MVERAELAWRGGRHIEATIRGHTLVADKPFEQGYTDKGPMSSELYLAALASCTMMSTLRVAEARKVALDGLEATAELDYDAQDRVSRIALEFRVRSPAPRREWEVIARLAGKFCTVEQLTKPPIVKRYVLNGKETVEAEKAE